jgi:hypothetical protein
MFGAGFPVVDMLSNLIRTALSGDVGQFENRQVGQRRAAATRRAGTKAQESTRRNLAARGLEGSSAGQAALTNIGLETDAQVFDSLISELTMFQNMAPGFGLGATGQGQQAMATAANMESRREASDPWKQILPMLMTTLGTAAGGAIGGPFGAAAGGGLASMFSRMFSGGGGGGGYTPTGEDYSRSGYGPAPVNPPGIGGGFVS